MLGFIKRMFIGLLTSLVNASNYTKCVSLNNQQCMIQPVFINLYPNEYSQGIRYYPFAINLDRCVGSYNTLDYLSSRLCVTDKAEELNLNVFNIITETNESTILRKHISCKCEFKFNGRKRNSNQKWNNNKCWCECKISKQHISPKNIIFGILLYVVVKTVNI